MIETTPKILSMAEVKGLTSLSRATIYKLLKTQEFPQQVRLTPRRIGFKAEQIQAWIESRQAV